MYLDLMERSNKKLKSRRDNSILKYIRQQRFNNRYSLTDRTKHYDALGDPYTSYYFSNRSVKDHLKKFRRAIMDEPNLSQKKRINKLVTLRIKESFKDYVCPKTLVYQKEMTNLELDILGKKSTANLNKNKSKQSLASNRTHHENIPSNSKNKEHLKQIQSLNYTLGEQIGKHSQSKQQNKEQVLQLKPQKNQITKPNHISYHLLKRKKRETTSKTHLLPQTQQSVELPSRNKTLNKEATDQKLFADRLAEELHQKKHERWLQFLQQKKKMLKQIRQLENTEIYANTNPQIAN